jgi:hypothetical protein
VNIRKFRVHKNLETKKDKKKTKKEKKTFFSRMSETIREGATIAAKKDRSANSLRRAHFDADDDDEHTKDERLEAKKAAEMLSIPVKQSGSGEAISKTTTSDALARNGQVKNDSDSSASDDEKTSKLNNDVEEKQNNVNDDNNEIDEKKENNNNVDGDEKKSLVATKLSSSKGNNGDGAASSGSAAPSVKKSTSSSRSGGLSASGSSKKIRSSEHVNLSGGTGWRMESFHKGLVPLEALSKARLLMAFDAADRQPNSFVWYEPYFFKNAHVNFLGRDRDAGWLFLSVSTAKVACWEDEVTDARVKLTKKLMYDTESDSYWSEHYGFRALVRWVGGDRQYVIGGNMVPMGTSRTARMLRAFQRVAPDFDAVRWVELPSKMTPGRLLALERAFLPNTLNAGLVLCTGGCQISSDADLYADIASTPRFERFCEMLGYTKSIENPYEVDAPRFKALITDSGTNNAALTINWHVNTLLPDTTARRRQIALASIVVLYLDTPGTVIAPFLCAAPEHCVFIVLSPEDDQGEFLRVEIIRRVGIVRYIPPLPDPPLMKLSDDFKHWIAAKGMCFVGGEERAHDDNHSINDYVVD